MKNKGMKDKKEQDVAEMLRLFENLGPYQKGIMIGYVKGLSEAVHFTEKNLKIS